MRAAVILVMTTALGVASAGAGEIGDPERGELLFRNHCGICHAIELPHTVFGPHLVDVFGREAGSVPNYRYSYEMGVSGIVWDEESLDALMADPQSLVPGTNMYFRGLPSEEDRAHIIAYLKQQSQSD
ncbi:MAG: c-type cytochrome [Hyphomicrobiales bacterium]